MLELMVEPNVYGDDLWMCFREWDWSGFGACESWFQPKMKLALIVKLMYLPRVQAKTQFKSESLKARENTIKEKTNESGRDMLVVRQQTREIRWDLDSRDSK